MNKKQLQDYKRKKAFRAIPRRIKQIILAAVFGISAHAIHAQPEKITEKKQDTIEQVTVSTYQTYKESHLTDIRAPFMHTLNNMLQERVEKMKPAERADRRLGKYYTFNRKKALQDIFGAVPTVCLRYYCAFAAFNTIKDAAIKCGCKEYAESVDKFLSNMNSCPAIIKDLTNACQKLQIDNPRGLTISERLERDAADNNIGAGVYACIVRSQGNTRSGLHFKLCVVHVDDKGQPLRDEKTNGILFTEYSFNTSSAETSSNSRTVPVDMFNFADISDKNYEIHYLKAYLQQKQQFNQVIAENSRQTEEANKKIMANNPALNIKMTDTRIY